MFSISTRPLGPRKTLTELTYMRLRDGILHGRIKPNVTISTGKLAKAMGTSSMPVRAALTRLETEGLLTIVPQKGVLISNISLVELEELFQIRSRLEGLAAFLACSRMTSEELEQLRGLLQKMKWIVENGDFKGWQIANERCHHMLYATSGNEQLQRLLKDLYRRGMGRRVATSNVKGHMKRRFGEHLAIFRAIERRESEKAERLSRDHILTGGEEILQFLRKM